MSRNAVADRLLPRQKNDGDPCYDEHEDTISDLKDDLNFYLGGETEEENNEYRTLYDILGAPEDATRTELKRRYIALARDSHPDAMIGRGVSDKVTPGADFNEVARAWQTLSNERDRERYDRKLAAGRLTDSVGDMAKGVRDGMGPLMLGLFEGFAVPLLRKTATAVVRAGAGAKEMAERKLDKGDERTP